MVESWQVENPTIDIKKIKKGDPVLIKTAFGKEACGFVIKKGAEAVGIWDFETGYPVYVRRIPKQGDIRKMPLKDVLDYCENISGSQLGKEVESGGLEGAWAARYKHDLDVLLTQLQKSRNPREQYRALMQYSKTPKTGVYAIQGYYSGAGPQNHFEGVVSQPRLEEDAVSRLMTRLLPNGFRNIPDDFPAVGGNLVKYGILEIPQEAVGLVNNPAQLRLEITDNGLTATCTYGEINDRGFNGGSTRRYSVAEDFSHKSFSLLMKSPQRIR